MSTINKSRREFLKVTSLTGAGLFLGFNWFSTEANATIIAGGTDIPASSLSFNSYLSVSTDGTITILSPNPELGQNIMTSFPMIVADELDADWTKVKVLQAPLDNAFDRQLTGGSGAVPHSWMRLRTAGATARQMLVAAAAQRWGVDAGQCSTESGYVVHAASGKKLSYGELAEEASKMPVPKDVKLKDRKDFKFIGKEIKNVANDEIVTGKGIFGLDFYREGMLFGMIQRPPAFGTKIKSVNADAAKAMPGIVNVITFKNNVAVLGKSTWEVMKAKSGIL